MKGKKLPSVYGKKGQGKTHYIAMTDDDLKNHGKVCYICKEPILDFEKTIEESGFVIHNRPGCIGIWNVIKSDPDTCVECGENTTNLEVVEGQFCIICENCYKMMGNKEK